MTLKLQPRKEQLDLNRNFPAGWRQEHEQYGAGPFPTSEPEVRAAVGFIVAASEHHRRDRLPHLQRRAAAAVLAPGRRHAAGRGPVDLPEDRREGHRADRLSEHLGVPRLPLSPEGGHHRLVRRLDVRPSRRVRLDGGDLEPAARRPASTTTSSSSGTASTRSRTISSCWNGTTRRWAARASWTGIRSSTRSSGASSSAAGTRSTPGAIRRTRCSRRRSRAFRSGWCGTRSSRRGWSSSKPPPTPLGDGRWRVRLVVQNTGWLPSYVTQRALKNKTRARGRLRDRAAGRGARSETGKLREELDQLEGRAYKPGGPEQLGGLERRCDRGPVEGGMGGARAARARR